jgi:dolichol-phosphate mannosyltransferase
VKDERKKKLISAMKEKNNFSSIIEKNGCEVSVVVPVFNEVGSVNSLVCSLEACLRDMDWEVIFVDDNSPDGTANAVKTLMRTDRRVRLLHRIGRRGLSSAVVEGILTASAEYVVVMDGDLQHDPAIIPEMLDAVRNKNFDIAVGTRFASAGHVDGLSRKRSQSSLLATAIANRLTGSQLTDPMSGFFLVRRDQFAAAVPKLSSVGFKILLDYVLSSPTSLKAKEVPYTMQSRKVGESKLGTLVVWEFGMLLAEKLFKRRVSARFISFATIGALGVVVHLIVLRLILGLGLTFISGHAIATLAAMTFNFGLNNFLTYADQRLRGVRILTGWLSFVLACSIGAAANIGVAYQLFVLEQFWLLSALAGILVGTVWNFAITSVFTWQSK